MVFDFLKKKFQGFAAAAVPSGEGPGGVEPVRYEERRAEAENLHAAGKTDEALAALDRLASDLAGEGSFPLAVAVRHQMSAWNAAPPVAETAAADGAAMVRERETTGAIRILHPAARPEAVVPDGLENSRFFAEMTSDEVAGFIASTVRRTFSEGEVVLEQGQEGRSFFIVTRGVLRVETTGTSGGALRVGVLTMGDVFGEVALLTGRPRTATVVSETGAECLEITLEAWNGVLGRHPRVRKVLEELHRERARFAADAILEDLRRRREGRET